MTTNCVTAQNLLRAMYIVIRGLINKNDHISFLGRYKSVIHQAAKVGCQPMQASAGAYVCGQGRNTFVKALQEGQLVIYM